MAAKRKPVKRRARTRRARAPRRGLPVLEQRHLDVIGLACVAAGVFLGFVLYNGADGGRAGRATGTALAWLLGKIRYGVPIAGVAGGGLLVMRPVVPSLRPFRTGAACLFAGLTLALAADTLGIAGAGVRHGFFHASFFEQRGGIVGEGLHWGAAQLVHDLRARIPPASPTGARPALPPRGGRGA